MRIASVLSQVDDAARDCSIVFCLQDAWNFTSQLVLLHEVRLILMSGTHTIDLIELKETPYSHMISIWHYGPPEDCVLQPPVGVPAGVFFTVSAPVSSLNSFTLQANADLTPGTSALRVNANTNLNYINVMGYW